MSDVMCGREKRVNGGSETPCAALRRLIDILISRRRGCSCSESRPTVVCGDDCHDQLLSADWRIAAQLGAARVDEELSHHHHHHQAKTASL